MTHFEQFESVVGSAAYDAQGHKLGEVGGVYASGVTGQPAWATVRSPLYEGNQFVVPLVNSSFSGSDLVVPYQEETVTHSPAIKLDAVSLTWDQEDELSRHYGLDEMHQPTGITPQPRSPRETDAGGIQAGSVSPGPGDPELDL